MNLLYRGNVLKAYLEIDPSIRSCDRLCLCLEGCNWIEFTGVTLQDGFRLPEPLGCECIVEDISDRQWAIANYEVTFASEYSRQGTFYAKFVKELQAI